MPDGTMLLMERVLSFWQIGRLTVAEVVLGFFLLK
jgi:hypothetical protein